MAQQGYVNQYRYDPTAPLVQWFPRFCDAAHDPCLSLPKCYPLSFVGSLNPTLNPERVRFITAIRERFPMHATTGSYVEFFNRSALVLNQCVANDVNFRTFQAMTYGSLLLMERVANGLEVLFQDASISSFMRRAMSIRSSN